MRPEPKNSPLMQAWEACATTAEFANARSLGHWMAFSAGWKAAAAPDVYAELQRVEAQKDALILSCKAAVDDLMSDRYRYCPPDLVATLVFHLRDAIIKAEQVRA